MGWTTIADLGAGPANEDCAQLGRNPHFETHNRLELAVFEAAIIALNGPPPKGLRYVHHANEHDFGTYRTLVLQNDPQLYNHEMAHIYAERLNIPPSWIAAGFSPPIDRSERGQRPKRTAPQCIASALNITRPAPDGAFFPPMNGVIHNNLTTAYPNATTQVHPDENRS